jgi:hypothetical protein
MIDLVVDEGHEIILRPVVSASTFINNQTKYFSMTYIDTNIIDEM